MKTFNEICKMTQPEVKKYMTEYLESSGYDPKVEDGFVYAEGDIPVLLVAHMDTVHRETCRAIHNVNGKVYSPQGIGGDDRCGIFMIMNIVKDTKCSVLLCEDEERGGIGAYKFVNSSYIKEVNVNYIIELDRMGNNDAVFYRCRNQEFTDFICDTTGFKEAFGTFSDISIIAPEMKVAAVNLSCGYYNAHTLNEYVVYDEMMDNIETVKGLIRTESEKFEYKTYEFNAPKQTSIFDMPSYNDRVSSCNSLKKMVRGDLTIEIEVVYMDDCGEECVGYGNGNTKSEAWLDFFMEYSDVSFGMIVDYSFN